jgi:hypothetical protein
MEEQLMGQTAACAAAGDEDAAMDWNLTLALVYLEQRRRDDAVVIFENVVEYWRRVLPENHLKIGVMEFCLLISR